MSTSEGLRRLPLHPGDHTIHFYFSPEQRLRFLPLLAEHRPGTRLVIAAPRQDFELLSECLRQEHVHSMNLTHVEVSPDWRRSLSTILDAVLLELQRGTQHVLLLADFDRVVPPWAAYRMESLLASELRGKRVSFITQYSAGNFREPLDVDHLRRFGLVVVADFYSHRSQYLATSDGEETQEIAALQPKQHAA